MLWSAETGHYINLFFIIILNSNPNRLRVADPRRCEGTGSQTIKFVHEAVFLFREPS